jgi:hypothetical protein
MWRAPFSPKISESVCGGDSAGGGLHPVRVEQEKSPAWQSLNNRLILTYGSSSASSRLG